MSRQRVLWPPSHADEAAVLGRWTLALLPLLLTKRGHLPSCAEGQWIGRYGTATGGTGAPCSPKCRELRDLQAAWRAFLAGAE